MKVRPAGSKGNGAFAAQDILKGTYLGDYDGELLDEASYWQRYPNGVVGILSCDIWKSYISDACYEAEFGLTAVLPQLWQVNSLD